MKCHKTQSITVRLCSDYICTSFWILQGIFYRKEGDGMPCFGSSDLRAGGFRIRSDSIKLCINKQQIKHCSPGAIPVCIYSFCSKGVHFNQPGLAKIRNAPGNIIDQLAHVDDAENLPQRVYCFTGWSTFDFRVFSNDFQFVFNTASYFTFFKLLSLNFSWLLKSK